jgi:DNA-binding MarR family transcriptional regulator
MSSDTTKIFSLLFAIGRRLREEHGHGKKSAAYSLLHFHTLRYIQERRRPLMRDVAAYLCITPPAATLLVSTLVQDKFLVRSFDKKDRRGVHLALTERGKKFLSRAVRARMKVLHTLFSALSPKERTELIAMLEKMSAAKR